MDTDSLSYKTFQRQFYNWTSKWSQQDYSENTISPDIIEIVSLLQAIGFKIDFFDSQNPYDILLMKNGKTGVRVNIQCANSGLRASLELPGDCRCPKNFSEASKWEVSGTAPNTSREDINEVGSDMLLPVPKPVQSVVRQVLNHLFHMLTNDHNQNELKSPRAESYYCTPKRSMTPKTQNQINENTVENKKVNDNNGSMNVLDRPLMSPPRYRSLDTLSNSNLPEPGALKKISTPIKESVPSVTCSSPDLTTASRNTRTSLTSLPSLEYLESSRRSSVGETSVVQTECSKLKQLQSLLSEVTKLFEMECKLPVFDVSKIKESTESLLTKEQSIIKEKEANRPYASSPNLNRMRSTSSYPCMKDRLLKPKCRAPIRSSSSSSYSSTTNPKTSIGTTGKKSPNFTTTATRTTSTTSVTKSQASGNTLTRVVLSSAGSKKFSHVKSTIPKGATKK